MEKAAKSKNKFLKFLPKAAYLAVTFHNPPFSPKSDNQTKTKIHHGPIVPIIPKEARRKSKNSSFEAHEPTSPKVSCMGQIQHKHNKKKKIKKETGHVSLPKDFKPSKVGNLFAKPPGKISDAGNPTVPGRSASLSQIKRFTSGRDSLANFDWTAQVAPAEGNHRDYFSDEDECEAIIPFSAPILVGDGAGGVALEPKKEINLWKRRAMAPPIPLQVDTP